jgi:hypothetical protein
MAELQLLLRESAWSQVLSRGTLNTVWQRSALADVAPIPFQTYSMLERNLRCVSGWNRVDMEPVTERVVCEAADTSPSPIAVRVTSYRPGLV